MLVLCIPALLIRYVLVRRSLGGWSSAGITGVIFLIATFVNHELGKAGTLRVADGVVGGGTVLTFLILYKKKKHNSGKNVNAQGQEVFFYYDGSSTIGPCEKQKMQELYCTGAINGQTPVIRGGESEWKTFTAYIETVRAD